MLIRCRVWVAAPEPWDQRTTPAMVDATPFLPGLSPVQGKAVIARFDGGRLSSEGGLLALREIESAELSWRSSRGSNPKSAPRISSASALISALRGSYGVFVTPSPSATACADATRGADRRHAGARAPGQEFFRSSSIHSARVRVADVGRKEFEEAHRGARAGGGHREGRRTDRDGVVHDGRITTTS